MRNGRRENPFGLDSVDCVKISTNKKSKLNRVDYFSF